MSRFEVTIVMSFDSHAVATSALSDMEEAGGKWNGELEESFVAESDA